MKQDNNITSTTIKRINGYLHRIIPIADKSGKIISYTLKPIMLEFNVRDILQVSIGAALLATPVSMSEEAWTLAVNLPDLNIALIAVFSIFLISIFVYFNFYKVTLKGFVFDFIKRVVGTYLISMIIVATILTLIQKCPWGIDNVLALKRIIIVTLPSAMGGTLSDTIK